MTKRSIRFIMEDLIHRNNKVLDSTDMDMLVSSNQNYQGIIQSYQWFNTPTYIDKFNEMLRMFDSSFSLVEFDWNEHTGGLWVFKHH